MNMEEAVRIEPGMVVQIDPASSEVFGGCMAVVSEVRGWGVIAYVSTYKGQWDYIRLSFENIESVGKAHWWQE